MISTNTIASLALLIISVVSAAVTGLLNTDHLGGLTIPACMLIGVFASIGAVLVAQLWRVQAVSGGGRFQLPPAVRAAVYIAIFVCIGLFAFDNRKTALLTDLPERASLSLSRYCKRKAPVVQQDEVAKQVRVARGCALILRAYRLGYAKKLGPCAPKKVAVTPKRTAGDGPKQEICRNRQRDEPLLHYAWRVLTDESGKAVELDPIRTLENNLSEFKIKLGYVSTLIASQRHAIASSPHAAHHLWVNLPKPRSQSFVERWLLPREDCSNRYTGMKTTLRWGSGDKQTSALIDHVFGRLLFDPRVGEPVGYCREYTIHWGAQVNSCTELAAHPKAFLRSTGALASVRAVLQRHHAKSELRQLRRRLGKAPARDPLPDPRRLVSFHCLIVDAAGTGKLQRAEVSIHGYTLESRELRTPKLSASGDQQLAVYKQLALLLGGIDYNGPVEQASIGDLAKRPAAIADVVGDGFALTRLDLLRQSDPFVAGSVAIGHTPVVDVYPFHFHLQNFVDAFRRVYRRQRGRL